MHGRSSRADPRHGYLTHSLSHKCGLRLESFFEFLVGGPPVWTLDRANAIADDVLRRRDLVETAGIFSQHLGLQRCREPALLHCLDRSPGVVAIVVIDV